jgi:hypothetical protein
VLRSTDHAARFQVDHLLVVPKAHVELASAQ